MREEMEDESQKIVAQLKTQKQLTEKLEHIETKLMSRQEQITNLQLELKNAL